MKIRNLLVAAMLLALGCGCTRKVYVPFERLEIMSDTVRLAAQRYDSVAVRDTLRIEMRGDTVRELRVRERLLHRVARDTVYRSLRDTVTLREPAAAERGMSRWERLRRRTGDLIAGFAAAVALSFALVLWRRGRRN